jgi:hypothetical protein
MDVLSKMRVWGGVGCGGVGGSQAWDHMGSSPKWNLGHVGMGCSNWNRGGETNRGHGAFAAATRLR